MKKATKKSLPCKTACEGNLDQVALRHRQRYWKVTRSIHKEYGCKKTKRNFKGSNDM